MGIQDVYKRHEELLRIARYYNPPTEDDALDAVQTLYLRLCEKERREGNLDSIFYNGSLNMVYIFTSLRNIIIDGYRVRAKIETLPEGYDLPDGDQEDEITDAELTTAIKTELKGLDEYARLMTLAYYNNGHSIRSLAKATSISVKNVFVTLKRAREKITERVKENPHKYPKI